MFERPLDFLNALKLKEVSVLVAEETEKEYFGKLLAFDIHLNILLDVNNKGPKLIRGEKVVWVDAINNSIREVKK